MKNLDNSLVTYNDRQMTYDEFIEIFKTESIVYITLKPYNFIDCGVDSST